MEEGVNLVNGERYKLLVRALAWNGNPSKRDEWFEVASEEFLFRKE